MFSATGRIGRLRSGYQLAAVIEDWRLATRQETLNTLQIVVNASLRESDKFWIEHPPFILELLMKPRIWWRWDKVTLSGDYLIPFSKIELLGNGVPTVVSRD